MKIIDMSREMHKRRKMQINKLVIINLPLLQDFAKTERTPGHLKDLSEQA